MQLCGSKEVDEPYVEVWNSFSGEGMKPVFQAVPGEHSLRQGVEKSVATIIRLKAFTDNKNQGFLWRISGCQLRGVLSGPFGILRFSRH